MLVPVSRALITGHRQHPETDPLGFEPGYNSQQITNRPGEPVELGDAEAVALAHVVECRLKLLALGNRRNLLVENLVATGGAKLAHLRYPAVVAR